MPKVYLMYIGEARHLDLTIDNHVTTIEKLTGIPWHQINMSFNGPSTITIPMRKIDGPKTTRQYHKGHIASMISSYISHCNPLLIHDISRPEGKHPTTTQYKRVMELMHLIGDQNGIYIKCRTDIVFKSPPKIDISSPFNGFTFTEHGAPHVSDQFFIGSYLQMMSIMNEFYHRFEEIIQTKDAEEELHTICQRHLSQLHPCFWELLRLTTR